MQPGCLRSGSLKDPENHLAPALRPGESLPLSLQREEAVTRAICEQFVKGRRAELKCKVCLWIPFLDYKNLNGQILEFCGDFILGRAIWGRHCFEKPLSWKSLFSKQPLMKGFCGCSPWNRLRKLKA